MGNRMLIALKQDKWFPKFHALFNRNHTFALTINVYDFIRSYYTSVKNILIQGRLKHIYIVSLCYFPHDSLHYGQ